MHLLNKYRNSNSLPGAALLIIKDGKQIFQETCGLASLEDKIQITASTTFRLASVTKQFTATCILLLEERGMLKLSDTLDKYFPDSPASRHSITMQNLLNHTSGLYDYESSVNNTFIGQLSDADVYKLVKENPKLLFAPGHRFKYSNTGYCLLSLIVEKVSGISFGEFLQKNIFGPLHMTSTVLYRGNENQISERAYGYKYNKGKFTYNDQGPTTATSGDGGIYTSLDDFRKRDLALHGGKIINHESLQKMFSPTILTSGKISNYGFGQEITTYDNHVAYYHWGSTSGFRNFYYHIPHLKLSIIFLSNRNSGGGEVFAQNIANHIIKQIIS